MAILERDDTGALAYLTLNDADRFNALSSDMIAALQAAFDAISGDRNIRAVVLRAEGKAFCPGHDLKEMTRQRQADDGGEGFFTELFANCTAMMTTIRKLPQPVIAQVQGIATAAGCQLVASCDMAVASQTAKFGVNGVDVGLFCSTPMVPLSRNIPRKHVFEMLTTGSFMNAERACEAGLVNRVTAPHELEAVTQQLAETVASKLGSAVALGKEAFYTQIELPVDKAYEETSKAIVRNLMDDNTAEGMRAFIDKRTPDWDQ